MNYNQLVQQMKESTLSPNNPSDKPKENSKIVYPIHNGKIKFRLIPDAKANTVQRMIYRHKIPDTSNQWGSRNVPCLKKHYNQPCPICDTINLIEADKGKECGVYRQYGAKTRAICNGMITEIGKEYNDVNVGDAVIMMYPKSVAVAISQLIVDNADNIQSIVGNNGVPIVIETKQGANGIPEYNVCLDIGFGGPVFKAVKNNDNEYDMFIETMPSLYDIIVTDEYADTVKNDALASADYIKTQYM